MNSLVNNEKRPRGRPRLNRSDDELKAMRKIINKRYRDSNKETIRRIQKASIDKYTIKNCCHCEYKTKTNYHLNRHIANVHKL